MIEKDAIQRSLRGQAARLARLGGSLLPWCRWPSISWQARETLGQKTRPSSHLDQLLPFSSSLNLLRVFVPSDPPLRFVKHRVQFQSLFASQGTLPNS